MDTIIPESTEQEVSVEQENATFFVLGDAAYTSEIIEEYNRNAVNKTNEFNANSDTKVKEYNTNATNKTTAFDNNYDTKVAAFNKNAETQTETFNSNAITKENSFNANATTSIQNYNANAEQKLYEFNANALSYEEGITDNSNRVKRLETDIFDSGIASGSLINIQDSTLAEFQEISVDGVCEQETTSGKQLLDVNTLKSTDGTISDGITTSKTLTDWGAMTWKFPNIPLSRTIYYVSFDLRIKSGTCSQINRLNIWNNDIFVQSYDFIANPTPSNIYQRYCIKFDLTNNTNIYNLNGINIQVGLNVIDVILEVKDIMLSPSSDYTYEKYTRGQPSPSPEFPQPISVIENSLKITSCNKNLVDLSEGFRKGYISASNGVFNDEYVSYVLNQKIKVVENKNMIYSSKEIMRNFAVHFYDKKNNFIKKEGNQNSKEYSFTIPSGCDYITLGGSYDSTTTVDEELLKNLNLQLEENTQATPLEQHLETQIEANLPEGEFIGKINDTYKDTLKVEYNEEDGHYHLMLNKNIGKIVLDGSENWEIKSVTTGYVYQLRNTDIALSTGNNVTGIVLSDRFPPSTPSKLWAENISGITNLPDEHYLRLKIEGSPYTTLKEFKQWLSENNVTVYYELATPVEIDLGIVDMLITYNEVTNLFTDSDLMPTINAKYYRNFINTIQNLQVNEKALKEELVDINSRLSALESANANVTSESEVIE